MSTATSNAASRRTLRSLALVVLALGVAGCNRAPAVPASDTALARRGREGPLVEERSTSPVPTLEIDTVARGLAVPWGIAFLPDGRVLVTERAGRIRLIERDTLRAAPWATLPVYADDPRLLPESGLMGIAVAPDYATSRQVYVLATTRPPSFDSTPSLPARATRRVRDLFGAGPLDARTGLVTQLHGIGDGGAGGRGWRVLSAHVAANYYHAGGALLVGPDSTIYASFGDAMHPWLAGPQGAGLGSVRTLRAADARVDGSPFATGLRNVQGLAIHPRTGEIFAIDHGPTGMPHEGGLSGHDELNVLRAGAWYGWGRAPSGAPGDTMPADVVPPIGVWRSAIAPAGLAFAPASWGEDQLLVTGLRSGALHRLQLARDAGGRWQVTGEARLLAGYGRLRALAVDPTGAVWVGTSNADGRGAKRPEGDLLLRLRVAR